MRTATTRTISRSRRSVAAVTTVIGSALLAAIMAAPAHAGETPNVHGKAHASVAAPSGGGWEWVQTGPLSFNHPLTGATRAYERISEVPALTIPFPGVWEVSYGVRTYTQKGLCITPAIFNNGTLIRGSESVVCVDSAEAGSQDTIGQTFTHTFAAGDVVTLHAYRIREGGHTSILSNADGRTQVTAHWVSPT
ncbi:MULTISPECIES: hypothetical protein [unclassified Nonomuraea]|uniref:hypothetical protein n=1 Tax=unclassified Nonomuraea TaxID=2593643 RepID=UPI0033C00B7B